MDKVLPWVRDRKGIGSRFAACMWIYTKAVLCDQRMRPTMVTEQDGRQRLEGDLEQRMHAIVESWNWVCEDLFKEEHEWVTQLTMSEWEERILADLDYNLDIIGVMRCASLWFTAPSRSNLYHEEHGAQEDIFHKATNTAIQWACGQTFGFFSLLVVP